jgi:hypothetical protein
LETLKKERYADDFKTRIGEGNLLFFLLSTIKIKQTNSFTFTYRIVPNKNLSHSINSTHLKKHFLALNSLCLLVVSTPNAFKANVKRSFDAKSPPFHVHIQQVNKHWRQNSPNTQQDFRILQFFVHLFNRFKRKTDGQKASSSFNAIKTCMHAAALSLFFYYFSLLLIITGQMFFW